MLLFTLGVTYVSVNSCCAYPFLGYCGAFARPDVTAGGGHLPTRGHPQAFDMHMVSYLNITLTTQKILLKYKQIGSSVNDGKN